LLHDLRQTAGLSPETAALGLGWPVGDLHALERGEKSLLYEDALMLATLCGVTPERLGREARRRLGEEGQGGCSSALSTGEALLDERGSRG
jgi:hypothetical protein